MWQSFWTFLSDDWRRNRRRYLIEGIIFAVVVVACAYYLRPYVDPKFRSQVQFQQVMAELCSSECDLMDQRAADCRQRAKLGTTWDDASEEAENLKICPYTWDTPATRTWADQAAVWERAATRGRKTVERYERAANRLLPL